MRFLFTATALLLLLSCFACHKKGVRGRVLEYGTDQPVKNATVVLSECESDGNFSGNIHCFEVGRTTTDADGSWSFESDGFTVGAKAPQYWSSGDDYEIISGDGKPIDLHLYPYAWLKVVLRNESGAYGFYPPRNGSGLPPLQLPKGGDTTMRAELVYGEKLNRYIFSVRVENGGGFPSNEYWSSVNVKVNGVPTSFSVDLGAFVDFTPVGHDTTTLTITY